MAKTHGGKGSAQRPTLNKDKANKNWALFEENCKKKKEENSIKQEKELDNKFTRT